MDPWKVAIRFYKELGTWEFTLLGKEKNTLEWYPKHWESVDAASEELKRLERTFGGRILLWYMLMMNVSFSL